MSGVCDKFLNSSLKFSFCFDLTNDPGCEYDKVAIATDIEDCNIKFKLLDIRSCKRKLYRTIILFSSSSKIILNYIIVFCFIYLIVRLYNNRTKWSIPKCNKSSSLKMDYTKCSSDRWIEAIINKYVLRSVTEERCIKPLVFKWFSNLQSVP